ncbi:MAG TPA: hypothetical protein PKN32_02430 [Bacteroidales bacterium]|nr:hypothetical protein [Bacteroidales bacterium]
MKTIKIILFASVLTFLAQNLFSQDLESIMESTWRGKLQSRDSKLDGGYFVCDIIIYDVFMIGETTFTATASRTLYIDGEKYFCQSDVTGKINTTNYSITLTHKQKYLYCQQLPHGIEWHTGTETLTLYNDEAYPGYYVMYGTSAGQLFDDELVMYSNH